jgi:bifunctional NMN adenylyltransferase/nudix hydrolase
MSATPIREAYYRGEIQKQAFPQGTIQFLENFQKTSIYRQLQNKFVLNDKSNLV